MSMISKKARQGRILEIIRQREISSQEGLAAALVNQEIHVTQSTLSRDIRELGLVKIRGRYQVAGEFTTAPPADNLRRSFQQLVVERGLSGNILMVKTPPGNAHSLGVVLDAVRWPEIMGTVAGDDTVFVLLRSAKAGRAVMRRMEGLLA